MSENYVGAHVRRHIVEMNSIRLKRKLPGD